MKKQILILLVLMSCTLCLATSTFGQLGDLVKKAKDVAAKKEKKVETGTTEKVRGENASEINRSESPVAQNQLGTFYFSNQPFAAGAGTVGAKESFSSSEQIFGRFVLKTGTIRSVLKPALDKRTQKQMIDFKLYRIAEGNGSAYIQNIGRIFQAVIEESDLDKNYWDFDVFPRPETAGSLFSWGGNPNDGLTYAFDLYLFLNNPQTKEGTYKIRSQIAINELDFRGNPISSEPTKIEGAFSFTFRGEDFASIKSNYDNLEKNFASNYRKQKTANQPLPSEWSAKSSPIIGGFTVATVTNLYLNSFSNPAANLKLVKFYAAPPKGQETWKIQNNEYGIPSYRYSSQWFTAFVKDTGTGACFYQGFGLRQNYAGAGTYNKTVIDHGDSALITCDKMGLK